MYAEMIRRDMAAVGRVGAADPRHVEAWMRLEHGTLDALSAAAFRREVGLALACIEAAGSDDSEALAASYAL